MSKKQKKSSWAIILIVALALSAFALVYGRARTRARTTDAARNSSRTSLSTSTLLGDSPPHPVEAELITIRPTGFEPAEISRPAGRFVLAFDNQSGVQQLVFNLQRENGQRVTEVRPRKKTELTQVLDLPAGLYQVTEANHPEWTLQLKLTGRQ